MGLFSRKKKVEEPTINEIEATSITFRSLNDVSISNEELHKIFDGKTLTRTKNGSMIKNLTLIHHGVIPTTEKKYELSEGDIYPCPVDVPQKYIINSNTNLEIE